MEQKSQIKERNNELVININEFNVDQIVFDTDKSECIITDKSTTSIEVFIKKKTTKGIDSYQWFDIRDFNKRFKK